MRDNNLENFRPQSPLSLYSYVAPAPVASQPLAFSTSSNPAPVEPAQKEASTAATKSILKKRAGAAVVVVGRKSTAEPRRTQSLAQQPPAQQSLAQQPPAQQSSRPATPVVPALVKNTALQPKTVAFGRTTNLCDTVTRTKPISRLPPNLLRARTYMTTTKEAEEIQTHIKRQDEEIQELRGQSADLVKTVDELKAKESNLTRALTSLSTRLMALEKKPCSPEVPKSPDREPHADPWLRETFEQITARLEQLEKWTPAASRSPDPSLMPPPQQKSAGRRVQPPPEEPRFVASPEMLLVPSQQQQKRVARRAQQPAALDRQVFSPEVTVIPPQPRARQPQPQQHQQQPAPMQNRYHEAYGNAHVNGNYHRTSSVNRFGGGGAGEGRVYGAKYTQRLTLHKEITTFSPDRAHLNVRSARLSEDDDYFDDGSDPELENYPQQQQPQLDEGGGGNYRRLMHGTQSARERRDRYRKN